jgi:hypothetical protein
VTHVILPTTKQPTCKFLEVSYSDAAFAVDRVAPMRAE